MPAPIQDPPTLVVPSCPPNGGAARLDAMATAGDRSRQCASKRASAASSAWPSHGQEDASPSRVSQRFARISQHQGRPLAKRNPLRVALQQSAWYHSSTAQSLRARLVGKYFAVIMVIALLFALFMPDAWIVAGMNSNVAIDVILTIVMILFTIELLALSVVDAAYLCSFFQLMDVIGTVSMMFDISYMLGTDATYAPVMSNQADAHKSTTLLRAARAAKIGARAGRLSRVLRILRFLPFLSGGAEKTRTGMASLISFQLANVLATRVACLTIILVMVIPLFDMWTFPQSDFSLRTWVERISLDLQEERLDALLDELALMETFYTRCNYWPWMACSGVDIMEDGLSSFRCDSGGNGSIFWLGSGARPSRNASSLRVISDNVMVAFNMHTTYQLKSCLNFGAIIFIICIMVFSGLAISSVVADLAVRPLERMLGTVRQIAGTVFKISAEVRQGDVDEEEAHIDGANEMKLLERVVQKLATIADLQGTKNIQATDDMRDEDLGILSMMQGNIVTEEQQRASQSRRASLALPRRRALAPEIRLEDFGVSQEVYESWAFNTLSLSKVQRSALAVFTVSRFHQTGEGFVTTQGDVQVLQRFIQAVEKEYLPVPFHSFAHAVDVAYMTGRLMQLTSSEAFLTDLEQFIMLIAACAHDLGHPGVNNGFLCEVGHELALQYNDRSPLENMHCSKLYAITSNPLANVFAKLSKEQYKETRKICIEIILHTDMMVHGAMVKDLQMMYQMNQEIFNAKPDGQLLLGGVTNLAEVAVFAQADAKMLIMEVLLHSADVSNPCRAWETSHAWAMVCLEEFFAQGDQEKTLGIPVQFLNDRDKLNKPSSQIGFIEFMIAPFFFAQIRLWPGLKNLAENLSSNLAAWADLWDQEVNPSEEEKLKVQLRVLKVNENLVDAVTRGGLRP